MDSSRRTQTQLPAEVVTILGNESLTPIARREALVTCTRNARVYDVCRQWLRENSQKLDKSSALVELYSAIQEAGGAYEGTIGKAQRAWDAIFGAKVRVMGNLDVYLEEDLPAWPTALGEMLPTYLKTGQLSLERVRALLFSTRMHPLEDYTTLGSVCNLVKAVFATREGQEIVLELIDRNPQLIPAMINYRQDMPKLTVDILIAAAQAHNGPVLEAFRQHIHTRFTSSELTLIDFASQYNQDGAIAILDDMGADVNARNAAGVTPLYLACAVKGQAAAVALICRGANIFNPEPGFAHRQPLLDEHATFLKPVLCRVFQQYGYSIDQMPTLKRNWTEDDSFIASIHPIKRPAPSTTFESHILADLPELLETPNANPLLFPSLLRSYQIAEQIAPTMTLEHWIGLSYNLNERCGVNENIFLHEDRTYVDDTGSNVVETSIYSGLQVMRHDTVKQMASGGVINTYAHLMHLLGARLNLPRAELQQNATFVQKTLNLVGISEEEALRTFDQRCQPTQILQCVEQVFVGMYNNTQAAGREALIQWIQQIFPDLQDTAQYFNVDASGVCHTVHKNLLISAALELDILAPRYEFANADEGPAAMADAGPGADQMSSDDEGVDMDDEAP